MNVGGELLTDDTDDNSYDSEIPSAGSDENDTVCGFQEEFSTDEHEDDDVSVY